MDKEQALGYFLKACQETNMPLEQVKEICGSVITLFDSMSPVEAEIKGKDWVKTFDNTQKNTQKYKTSTSNVPRRRFNHTLPTIPVSNSTRKIREENRKIIMELDQIERGPFGLCRLFRR